MSATMPSPRLRIISLPRTSGPKRACPAQRPSRSVVAAGSADAAAATRSEAHKSQGAGRISILLEQRDAQGQVKSTTGRLNRGKPGAREESAHAARQTAGPINSASDLSASAAAPLTTTPPCRTDDLTTASPQYVMLPPCSTSADKAVPGLVKILPPLYTEAVTFATGMERISIVPPWLTATADLGLRRELATALDRASLRDGNGAECRRHDLDLEVVIARAVRRASIDHESAVVADRDRGLLRITLEQGHALRLTMNQIHLAAIAQLDRAERRRQGNSGLHRNGRGSHGEGGKEEHQTRRAARVR